MVVTSNKKLAKTVRELRVYGEVKRYHSTRLITHSRLDEIQAAILRVKLKTLDEGNKKRRAIAALYRKHLEGISLAIPKENGEYHVYHLFVIQTLKRELLKKFLEKNGVDTLIHYPVPIHLVPSFSSLGYKKEIFLSRKNLQKQFFRFLAIRN